MCHIEVLCLVQIMIYLGNTEVHIIRAFHIKKRAKELNIHGPVYLYTYPGDLAADWHTVDSSYSTVH
jgi:hypothetical protein